MLFCLFLKQLDHLAILLLRLLKLFSQRFYLLVFFLDFLIGLIDRTKNEINIIDTFDKFVHIEEFTVGVSELDF
jgi:hypothetical protein